MMTKADERREETKRLQKQTADRFRELEMMTKGERIEWLRRSPTLKRDITVYLDVLTPEQKQRLDEIEKELLAMAYEAKEETTTKTILKKSKPQPDEEPR